jgi:hypothetical protein
MDKGFYSASNICEPIESDRNLSLIIPLPFTLKLSKELIANNLDVKNPQNMFQYNEEILCHKERSKDKKRFWIIFKKNGYFYPQKISISEKLCVSLRILCVSLRNYDAEFRREGAENRREVS